LSAQFADGPVAPNAVDLVEVALGDVGDVSIARKGGKNRVGGSIVESLTPQLEIRQSLTLKLRMTGYETAGALPCKNEIAAMSGLASVFKIQAELEELSDFVGKRKIGPAGFEPTTSTTPR
jgi:hypothetical protein